MVHLGGSNSAKLIVQPEFPKVVRFSQRFPLWVLEKGQTFPPGHTIISALIFH